MYRNHESLSIYSGAPLPAVQNAGSICLGPKRRHRWNAIGLVSTVNRRKITAITYKVMIVFLTRIINGRPMRPLKPASLHNGSMNDGFPVGAILDT